MSGKLKFSDLKVGERFICWPVPGDDAGHGEHRGAQRLLTKTAALTATSHYGVESSMTEETQVIKVMF